MRNIIVFLILASFTTLAVPVFADEKQETEQPPERKGLWPLLWYERKPDKTTFHLLYPFFEYEKDKERTLHSFYPLISFSEFSYETRIDFLFPFTRYLSAGVYRKKSDETELYLIPFFSYSTDQKTNRFTFNLLLSLFSFSTQDTEFTLRLFPLFGYTRNYNANTTEFSFLYPLGLYSSSPEKYSLRFVPFLWYLRDYASNSVEMDFLYPLGQYFSEPGSYSVRFFPLFRYKKDETRTNFHFLAYLGRYYKDENETHFRFFPFFSFSSEPYAWTFFIMPFYRRQEFVYDEKGKVVTYERSAIYPLLDYSRQRNTAYRYDYDEEGMYKVVEQEPYYINRYNLLCPIFIPPDFLRHHNHPIPLIFLLNYESSTTGETRIYALSYLMGMGFSESRFQMYIFPVLFAKVYSEGTGHIVLFPILWHYSYDYTLSLLLPIFLHYQDPTEYQILFGPFGYWQNFQSGDRRYYLFYPFSYIHDSRKIFAVRLFPWLYGYERTETSTTIDMFPLFLQRDISNDTYRFVLFPILWLERTEFAKYNHIWPLFGYDYSHDGTMKRYSIAFPFGFTLKTDRENDSLSLHLFAPVFLDASLIKYEREPLKRYDFSDRSIMGRRTTLAVIPAFKYTTDPMKTEFDLVYPYFPAFLRYKREMTYDGVSETDLSILYFLFKSRFSSDEKYFTLLWPLSLFTYSKKGETIDINTLYYLLYYHRTPEISEYGFLDTVIYYKSDRAHGSIAFEINPILWRGLPILLKYASDPEKTEFRFLYKIIYYEKTKNWTDFQLNPIFYYKDSARGWETGILGGLLGIGSTEGDNYLKLFWFLKAF
jgi:hypothetical protein